MPTASRKGLLALIVVFVSFAIGGVALWLFHHKDTGTSQPKPIKISDVDEPAELLVTPRIKLIPTREQAALMDSMKDLKNGNEVDQLPKIDAYIQQFPAVGDAYFFRSVIRCMKGDVRGTRQDVEHALTLNRRIIPSDSPTSDKNELLAIRAKLSFLDKNDDAALNDIGAILDSYSSDINYLTDGRVNTTDKANSVCAWTPWDIESLVLRSQKDPRVLLFEGIFYAAFSSLDHQAGPVAVRALQEATTSAPNSAQPYFYTAVSVQKEVVFKSIAFTGNEREQYYRRLVDLYSKAININGKIAEAYAKRAEAYLDCAITRRRYLTTTRPSN